MAPSLGTVAADRPSARPLFARLALVNIAQSLENLKLEQDAIVLYDALADDREGPAPGRGVPPHRRQRAPARGHLGEPAARARGRRPPPGRPRVRVRFIIVAARVLRDARRVRPREGPRGRRGGDLRGPGREPGRSRRSPPTSASTPRSGSGSTTRPPRAPGRRAGRPPRTPSSRREHPAVDDGEPRPPAAIARGERWHRSAPVGDAARGHLRGLATAWCRNLALVMGVAGASGQRDRSSCSPASPGCSPARSRMAAGEYISMQSQRELFERQIDLERAELEAMPEEEQRELAAIYMAKGFPHDEADRDRRAACSRTRRRARHPRPRGARPRPRRARLAVGRRVRLVPRVRARRRRSPCSRTCSRRDRPRSPRASCSSLVALFLVGAGRQPAHRPRRLLFSGLRQVAIGARRPRRDLRRRPADRRRRRGLGAWPRDARQLETGCARGGPRPGLVVERAARPVCGARPRLRQGPRVRAGLDPVRAARARRRPSTSRPGDRLDLPAGTAHDALVGPGWRDLPRGAPARGAPRGLVRRGRRGSW